MATKPDATGAHTLVELITEQLKAAEAAETQARENIEAAKIELTAARAEVKKHRTMLFYCTGQASSTTLTKQNVRPIVERLLKEAGPLSEADLQPKLEIALKEESLPLTGLALVLRPLRSEFADTQGKWSIGDSAHASPASRNGGAQ